MKRIGLTIVVAAAVVMLGRAAQAPPDLSGKWRPQNSNSGQVNPFELTITQAADIVTIRQPLGNTESMALKLNAETRMPIGGRGGATATAVSTAAWEGAKLVVTTAITGLPNGATNSSKQVYSLTADGLSLEASNSLPDGSMTPARTVTYVKYTPVPMPAPTSHPVEPGYTSLFNGKDLSGWKASENPDSFKVENGAIIANAVGGASHLFYDGAVGNHSFTNFDLRLDVLARYRSNGGVYVMTEFQPQGFPGKGFEIQVNNSHGDRIRTGSLYHIVESFERPWKRRRVDPDADQRSEKHDHRHGEGRRKSSAGHSRPAGKATTTHPSRKIAPGTIAFQSHDTFSVTAYSNIRIKLLN